MNTHELRDIVQTTKNRVSALLRQDGISEGFRRIMQKEIECLEHVADSVIYNAKLQALRLSLAGNKQGRTPLVSHAGAAQVQALLNQFRAVAQPVEDVLEIIYPTCDTLVALLPTPPDEKESPELAGVTGIESNQTDGANVADSVQLGKKGGGK